MDSRPADMGLGGPLVDDEEDVDEGPGGPTLGAAFVLGAVVGAAAATLWHDTEPDRPRPRVFERLRPSKPDPTPPSLSEVARDEAASVIRGLIREVGHVATHWLSGALEPSAPQEHDRPGEPGRDGG